jgi:hypothetical protein
MVKIHITIIVEFQNENKNLLSQMQLHMKKFISIFKGIY